ncbi:hypothetical protein LPJ61_004999, partial [Coemansia biformis]
MFLCGRLLDPDGGFAAFLTDATIAEPAADLGLGGARGDIACVLSEVLLIWQQLETVPRRAHFSPAVAGICGVIGAILVSRALACRELQKANVSGKIARAMGFLDIDEAYLAWRLLALAQGRCPDPSPDVQEAIDRLWSAMMTWPTDYLQEYVTFGALVDLDRPPRAAPGAVSGSLEALFATPDDLSIDDCYAALQ